jgi:geranylgeranyl pyrophosphate synthase
VLDVELETHGDISYEDVITMYIYKTAYYTISAPLIMGAVLGGVGGERLEAMRKFGQNLGIAFQIQDDIRDIFSDTAGLGKEPGGDIREGKQTLLFLYAREHSDLNQKRILEQYYGKAKISGTEIEVVREVFRQTRAVEYLESEVAVYGERAKKLIKKMTDEESFRKLLEEMVEYFVSKK